MAAKILYVSINTSKQFNYLVYMDLLTHDIQSLLVTLSLVTVLQMWWCVPHWQISLSLEPESQPRPCPEPSNIKYDVKDQTVNVYAHIELLTLYLLLFIHHPSFFCRVKTFVICLKLYTLTCPKGVGPARCYVVNKFNSSWACCKAWINPARSHIIAEAEYQVNTVTGSFLLTERSFYHINN